MPPSPWIYQGWWVGQCLRYATAGVKFWLQVQLLLLSNLFIVQLVFQSCLVEGIFCIWVVKASHTDGSLDALQRHSCTVSCFDSVSYIALSLVASSKAFPPIACTCLGPCRAQQRRPACETTLCISIVGQSEVGGGLAAVGSCLPGP